jgi:outer membrane receptor protein involved in Fe transport
VIWSELRAASQRRCELRSKSEKRTRLQAGSPFSIRSQFELGVSSRLAVVTVLAIVAPAVGAQSPSAADTSGYTLPSVVVTADRIPGVLGTRTGMVNRLSADALSRQPLQRLTDGLRSVPGLIVINAGSMGDQPRLLMRGFYGGGETDYAAVLMNGVPLTTLSTGLANWDVVPLAAVRAIEIVRGSSSALYGDAAVGGVINIITNAEGTSPARWLLTAGEYGTVDGSGAWSGSRGERQASVFGGYRRSDGFRAHEHGDAISVGGTADLFHSDCGALSLSLLHHSREFDDPGPLPDGLLESSPRASVPFFRFDQTAEQLRRASLRGSARINDLTSFSGYLTDEDQSADIVRTLQLAPDFGDTRSRRTVARRWMSSAQVTTELPNAPWPQRFMLGTDLSIGNLNSEYRPLLMGSVADYAVPDVTAGDVDVSGRGGRDAAAVFAHWENLVTERLRLVAGGRMDWLRDDYRAELPAQTPRMRSTHRAFSPKLGLNFGYFESATQTGHVYTSFSRSFKAATLDQLFDQRPIPIPFPPFSVTTSNPNLRPQRGSAIEGGVIHRAALGAAGTIDMTAAVYQQQMRDELDFDLATFRYINVGRSRHRGTELGARVDVPAATSIFASFARQAVLAMNGPNTGRQLKAVPRQSLSAGITGGPTRLQGSLSVTDLRGAFLDDANQRRLPSSTRVDARLATTVASLRFHVDLINALDRKLVSTGFPDPSGTDVVYYQPSARRVLQLGVGSGW